MVRLTSILAVVKESAREKNAHISKKARCILAHFYTFQIELIKKRCVSRGVLVFLASSLAPRKPITLAFLQNFTEKFIACKSSN